MDKVKIFMKSGAVHEIKCDKFTVLRNSDNTINTISWENAKPTIMYMCLSEIETILDLS
jgi:hypothetical protein